MIQKVMSNVIKKSVKIRNAVRNMFGTKKTLKEQKQA